MRKIIRADFDFRNNCQSPLDTLRNAKHFWCAQEPNQFCLLVPDIGTDNLFRDIYVRAYIYIFIIILFIPLVTSQSILDTYLQDSTIYNFNQLSESDKSKLYSDSSNVGKCPECDSRFFRGKTITNDIAGAAVKYISEITSSQFSIEDIASNNLRIKEDGTILNPPGAPLANNIIGIIVTALKNGGFKYGKTQVIGGNEETQVSVVSGDIVINNNKINLESVDNIEMNDKSTELQINTKDRLIKIVTSNTGNAFEFKDNKIHASGNIKIGFDLKDGNGWRTVSALGDTDIIFSNSGYSVKGNFDHIFRYNNKDGIIKGTDFFCYQCETVFDSSKSAVYFYKNGFLDVFNKGKIAVSQSDDKLIIIRGRADNVKISTNIFAANDITSQDKVFIDLEKFPSDYYETKKILEEQYNQRKNDVWNIIKAGKIDEITKKVLLNENADIDDKLNDLKKDKGKLELGEIKIIVGNDASFMTYVNKLSDKKLTTTIESKTIPMIISNGMKTDKNKAIPFEVYFNIQGANKWRVNEQRIFDNTGKKIDFDVEISGLLKKTEKGFTYSSTINPSTALHRANDGFKGSYYRVPDAVKIISEEDKIHASIDISNVYLVKNGEADIPKNRVFDQDGLFQVDYISRARGEISNSFILPSELVGTSQAVRDMLDPLLKFMSMDKTMQDALTGHMLSKPKQISEVKRITQIDIFILPTLEEDTYVIDLMMKGGPDTRAVGNVPVIEQKNLRTIPFGKSKPFFNPNDPFSRTSDLLREFYEGRINMAEHIKNQVRGDIE